MFIYILFSLEIYIKYLKLVCLSFSRTNMLMMYFQVRTSPSLSMISSLPPGPWIIHLARHDVTRPEDYVTVATYDVSTRPCQSVTSATVMLTLTFDLQTTPTHDKTSGLKKWGHPELGSPRTTAGCQESSQIVSPCPISTHSSEPFGWNLARMSHWPWIGLNRHQLDKYETFKDGRFNLFLLVKPECIDLKKSHVCPILCLFGWNWAQYGIPKNGWLESITRKWACLSLCLINRCFKHRITTNSSNLDPFL